MFDIFLKKQQYRKVSSKFKDHFELRSNRVGFVTSKDTRIEDKMQIFKSLINDGVNVQKKPNVKKASYFREKTRPQADELYNKQINQLGRMTDGFIEWNNSKLHQNKQKENIFGWNNEKKDIQEKKQKQEINFGNVLKQRLDLRELRATHRTEKYQNRIKARMQNSVMQKSQKPFHLTYRNDPKEIAYIIQLQKSNQKNRYKLAKYFGEINDFSYHKKCSSNDSFAFEKESRCLPSMNSTAYCTPSSYRRSGTVTPCENVSQHLQSPQGNAFRDDKINIDKKNVFSRSEIQSQVSSSVPLSQMNILHKNEKIQKMLKTSQKFRKSSLCKIHSVKRSWQKTTTEEKEKSVFRAETKCPFDIKKLTAVKKVQCL